MLTVLLIALLCTLLLGSIYGACCYVAEADADRHRSVLAKRENRDMFADDFSGPETATMGMFKDDVGGTRPPKQSSAPQNTAVGGGSCPTKSKIATPTSAPADPHTMGRAPGGWLK